VTSHSVLLRGSGEANSHNVDLDLVTATAEQLAQWGEDAGGLPHAAALITYTDAVISGDPERIRSESQKIEAKLGSAALVRAACVVGNFERMNRVADATGIPLDAGMQFMSSDVREQVGANTYQSASQTPTIGPWATKLGTSLRPLVLRIMAAGAGWIAKR
jgi:hypothetical protein